MPLFNESLESIAQAVVTVKRALDVEGVIEEQTYRGLNDYLAKRAKDFKIKKSHLEKAARDLDDELKTEVEEFFMDEGEALCNMAEELLEEHEKDASEPYNWVLKERVKPAVDKQAAVCKAWANMDYEERVAMAALARGWVEGCGHNKKQGQAGHFLFQKIEMLWPLYSTV